MRPHRLRLHLLAAAAAALAGCATSAPPRIGILIGGASGGGTDPSAVPAPVPPAPPPLLATEQRWLSQWFVGTPVQIALQGDGQLAVEVPLDYCFDAGAARVKAPLAAVLDRVAQSALRQGATRVHVAAPGDARGAASQPLALRRATAVRAYLTGRGVAPQRFSVPLAHERSAVALRLEPVPA